MRAFLEHSPWWALNSDIWPSSNMMLCASHPRWCLTWNLQPAQRKHGIRLTSSASTFSVFGLLVLHFYVSCLTPSGRGFNTLCRLYVCPHRENRYELPSLLFSASNFPSFSVFFFFLHISGEEMSLFSLKQALPWSSFSSYLFRAVNPLQNLTLWSLPYQLIQQNLFLNILPISSPGGTIFGGNSF